MIYKEMVLKENFGLDRNNNKKPILKNINYEQGHNLPIIMIKVAANQKRTP